MAKRHSDALFIQQGACNPSGIAHSLVNACKECLDEGVSQREDPAVRLIVHQLAFLCNIDEIDSDVGTIYSDLERACHEANTAEQCLKALEAELALPND